MPLLIDTYNVLHITGILPPALAGIDTPGLADLIAQSRYHSQPTVLICDGAVDPQTAESSTPLIRILAAGPGQSADALIIHMANCSDIPRSLTIVTEDKEILRAVRKRKCRTLSSHKFLEQLTHDAQTTPKSIPPPKPTQTDPNLRAQLLDHAGDIKNIKPHDLPHHLKDPPTPQWDGRLGRQSITPPHPSVIPAKAGNQKKHPSRHSRAGGKPEATPAPTFPPSLLKEAEQILKDLESKP